MGWWGVLGEHISNSEGCWRQAFCPRPSRALSPLISTLFPGSSTSVSAGSSHHHLNSWFSSSPAKNQQLQPKPLPHVLSSCFPISSHRGQLSLSGLSSPIFSTSSPPGHWAALGLVLVTRSAWAPSSHRPAFLLETILPNSLGFLVVHLVSHIPLWGLLRLSSRSPSSFTGPWVLASSGLRHTPFCSCSLTSSPVLWLRFHLVPILPKLFPPTQTSSLRSRPLCLSPPWMSWDIAIALSKNELTFLPNLLCQHPPSTENSNVYI